MFRACLSSLRVYGMKVDGGELSHFHRCVQALDGKVA